MLDLVLALRWVRDNIAAFGGDPGLRDLVGPVGRRREDRDADGDAGRGRPVSPRRHDERPAADGLGSAARGGRARACCSRSSACRASASRELATMPVAELLRAHAATVDPYIGRGSCYMGPVLDERTLTRHPFYPDAPPQSAGIPMMIGNTHDETRSLIGRGDPGAFDADLGGAAARLEAEMRVDISGAQVVAEYRRAVSAVFAGDVFFAATTAGRSWRARHRRGRTARGAGLAGLRLPARLGLAARTAASGARSTRSTSR